MILYDTNKLFKNLHFYIESLKLEKSEKMPYEIIKMKPKKQYLESQIIFLC